MFKGLLLVFSVVSASAFACPNLQGIWTCHNSDNPAPQLNQVVQQTLNGVTTYQITAPGNVQTLITDGQDHAQVDPATGGSLVSNATCTSDTHLIGKMTLKSDNPPINMTGIFDFQLVNEQTMTATANVTFNMNGTSQNQSQTASCTRN